MNQTVKITLENGRCLGCGTCVGECPRNVLSLQFTRNGELEVFFSNPENCTGCGLCLKACQHGFDLYTDNELLRSGSIKAFKTNLKDEIVYALHSTNSERRESSASGGFVTEFLLYLLHHGYINKAVEVRRRENDPLLSQAYVVQTDREIKLSRSSVYSPADYSGVISYLKQADETDRFAIVGLPCQLAFLKAWLNEHPKHNSKVFVLISLVCGHTPSLKAYDYILKRVKISKEDLKFISNRGGGWPGYLSIQTKSGRTWRTPYGSWLSWGMLMSSPLMMSKGCLFCVDPCGFVADISVSDAWLPEYRTIENPGENLVWIHNKSVKKIFECMIHEGVIESTQETFTRFVDANKPVYIKKTYLTAAAEKIFLSRSLRKPELDVYYRRLGVIQKFNLYWLYKTVWLFRRFSHIVPLTKPLLFYTKVLSWLSKRNILKNEKYIDRSSL